MAYAWRPNTLSPSSVSCTQIGETDTVWCSADAVSCMYSPSHRQCSSRKSLDSLLCSHDHRAANGTEVCMSDDKERCGRAGISSAADVCGLPSFQGPVALWRELTTGWYLTSSGYRHIQRPVTSLCFVLTLSLPSWGIESIKGLNPDTLGGRRVSWKVEVPPGRQRKRSRSV